MEQTKHRDEKVKVKYCSRVTAPVGMTPSPEGNRKYSEETDSLCVLCNNVTAGQCQSALCLGSRQRREEPHLKEASATTPQPINKSF